MGVRGILAALALARAAAGLAAGTNYVAPGGSSTSPYDTWAKAATSIHWAVGYACSNLATYDTVMVSNGTYGIINQIAITNSITVRSVNGPDVTTLRYSSGMVITISNALAQLIGFKITGGTARGLMLGDGIVSNCLITGNTNKAGNTSGGGVYMSKGVLRNSVVSHNRTTYGNGGGAGIYVAGSGGLIEGCAILSNDNNTAYTGGGGIWVNGSATIRNCLVARNNANYKGGCGGGILGGTVDNCTIIDNQAGGYGGGTRNSTIRNSIVYFNTASGDQNISGGTVTYSCSTPLPAGAGNIAGDPLFANRSDGDYHLRYGSPAIDAGTNLLAAGVTKDLEGRTRPLDGSGYGGGPIFDMGCYEAESCTADVFRCSFVASTNQGFSPLTVVFTGYVAGSNEVTNATWYGWDFGAGQASQSGAGSRVVTNEYSSSGLYDVALTVSNSLGMATNQTQWGYIRVVGATAYVATNGSDEYPYDTWEKAAACIHPAVEVAEMACDLGAADAKVLVSNGVYGVSNQIVIQKSIAVQSVNGWDATVIQRSSGSFSLLFMTNSGALVSGFTLSGGNNRGIILGDGTISNCMITSNLVYGNVYGGGVYMSKGTLANCIVANNTGSKAGGAGGGAGIYVVGTNVFINECMIYSNICEGYGPGAGVYVAGGATLRNCLIARNIISAGSANGGGVNVQSKGTMENCTIADNRATGIGGGVYNGSANAVIRNSIVYFNTAGGDQNISGGTVTYSCSTPLPAGAGNITNDPCFVDAGTNNYRLLPESPCINTGTNQEWMFGGVALDGNRRIGKRIVDMGAYEINSQRTIIRFR